MKWYKKKFYSPFFTCMFPKQKKMCNIDLGMIVISMKYFFLFFVEILENIYSIWLFCQNIWICLTVLASRFWLLVGQISCLKDAGGFEFSNHFLIQTISDWIYVVFLRNFASFCFDLFICFCYENWNSQFRSPNMHF